VRPVHVLHNTDPCRQFLTYPQGNWLIGQNPTESQPDSPDKIELGNKIESDSREAKPNQHPTPRRRISQPKAEGATELGSYLFVAELFTMSELPPEDETARANN
jgi:hypothetical protein